MSEQDNGGMAFPMDFGGRIPLQGGMTLRDYFAASAVNGLMGRVWGSETNSGDEIIKMWAVSAYAVADAMLSARSQP